MDIDIGAILRRIPPVTRFLVSTSVILACITTIKPDYSYYLYFSKDLFINNHEFWRLFTGLLYFGPISLNFAINMYVFWNYSQQLELNSFYNKRADYLYLIFLVTILITCCAMLFPYSVLLGNALINTLLYIWSRKNPFLHVQLLFVPMTAPYLPWAFTLMSTLSYQKVPVADLIGIFCGHVYYYFADVLPKIARLRGWRKQQFVEAPKFFKYLCGELQQNPNLNNNMNNNNMNNINNNNINNMNNNNDDEEEDIRRQEELFRQMEEAQEHQEIPENHTSVHEETNDHTESNEKLNTETNNNENHLHQD